MKSSNSVYLVGFYEGGNFVGCIIWWLWFCIVFFWIYHREDCNKSTISFQWQSLGVGVVRS